MTHEIFRILFSKKSVISYFKTFGIALIVMGISLVYMLNNRLHSVVAEHYRVIDKIITTEGEVDLSTICTAVNAKRIHYNGKMYRINEKFRLVPTNKKVTIKHKTFDIQEGVIVTTKLCEIIHYEKDGNEYVKPIDMDIFIALGVYMNEALKLAQYTLILFWILSFLLHIKYSMSEHKASQVESKSLLLEAETRLQRTLTEFAHHEMTLPIAIIKTMFDDMYRRLYGCSVSHNGICSFVNGTFEKCGSCNVYSGSKEDDKSKHTYTQIHLAIEGLESVLNQMSETKSIKYSNGNISIAKLIRSSVQGVNIDVNKISSHIELSTALEKFSVAKPATNGLILNIISNHVTNSKEALATEVIFKHRLIGNKIELYIKDNGGGIRDSNDQIIPTENLFDVGVSTKDANGKNIFIRDSKIKIFVKKLFGLVTETRSTRGVGLFLNRELMKKHGGNTELVETSSNGTTFKLTFPCKRREI